jgi:hypothetical protein
VTLLPWMPLMKWIRSWRRNMPHRHRTVGGTQGSELGQHDHDNLLIPRETDRQTPGNENDSNKSNRHPNAKTSTIRKVHRTICTGSREGLLTDCYHSFLSSTRSDRSWSQCSPCSPCNPCSWVLQVAEVTNEFFDSSALKMG